MALPCSRQKHTKITIGASAAPSTLQGKIWSLIECLECIQYYLDNLLILSNRSFEDCIDEIGNTIARLHIAGLKVRANKCNFIMTKFECSGFIISYKGIGSMAKKSKLCLILNP